MSKEILTGISNKAQAENRYSWSLYFFKIDRRVKQQPYKVYKIRFKNDAYLTTYGFTLEKDINASVPRMTLSLNMGRWEDESTDIYELIYRHMEPSGDFTQEVREVIKKLHKSPSRPHDHKNHTEPLSTCSKRGLPGCPESF